MPNIPHTESKTPTTESFLSLDLEIVWFSWGSGNPYRHPSPTALIGLGPPVDPTKIYLTKQHQITDVTNVEISLWVNPKN